MATAKGRHKTGAGTEYAESTERLFPKQLNSRHRILMRLLITGMQLKDAAKEVDYNLQRAQTIVSSPLFKLEKSKMEKEIRDRYTTNESKRGLPENIRSKLQDEALFALDEIVRLRDKGTSEGIRQRSAFDILDRAGYKAPDKFEGIVAVEATEGLVNALQRSLKEQKPENGNVEP